MGVSLIFHCPDPAFAEVLAHPAKSWAERTGATLSLQVAPMSSRDNSDIGIIEVPELGSWAERSELTPVPTSLRAPDHPFQWNALLPEYRELLIQWGGQAQAIPLAGDGYLIVYRADRLKDPKFIAEYKSRFGDSKVPLATWEEFARIAEVLTRLDGRPSLPAMTGPELEAIFYRVAACHDRAAQSESKNTLTNAATGLNMLSFQFDLATGKPRLNEPAFREAAKWLQELAEKKCLPPLASGTESDPAAAFAANQASIAIFSLKQLARLPREDGAVAGRYGLAALPGSRRVYDAAKREIATRASANYIPYFAGGRLGVVRASCKNPTAAFDLLAELGGPIRSQEIIASTHLGAGPFRVSQLEHDHVQLWFGYGFDAARTDTLRNCLLQYIEKEVKNPTTCLRGPDASALSSAAAVNIGSIARGTPAQAALGQLVKEWDRLDDRESRATLLKWRKLAAGLQ